jgi:hypothetical protein
MILPPPSKRGTETAILLLSALSRVVRRAGLGVVERKYWTKARPWAHFERRLRQDLSDLTQVTDQGDEHHLWVCFFSRISVSGVAQQA